MNGLITLLPGGLIWIPLALQLGLAGTLVGVNLPMTGSSRLMLGLSARRVAG